MLHSNLYTRTTAIRRCSLFILYLALNLGSGPISAQQDALLTAAEQSPLAPNSVLMDIHKVGNDIIAIGERGHIILAEENLTNWQQSQVPVRSNLTTSFFINNHQGWAAGHDGVILGTLDGGKSWQKLLDGNQINHIILEQAQQQVKQLNQQLEQEPLSSAQQEQMQQALENAEYALQDAESFLAEGASRPFLDIWFKNSKEGYAIGAFGLMLRTTDAGASWHSWSEHMDNPDGFHLNAIKLIGDKLYIAAEAGYIFRSDDWGQSWVSLNSPYEGTFFGLEQAAHNGLIVYGLRGKAFLSKDFGASWQEINTQTSASLFGSTRLSNGSLVLVGDAGTVLTLTPSGSLLRSEQHPNKLPISSVASINHDHILSAGLSGIENISRFISL